MATVRVSQVAGHPDEVAWSQTVVYPRAQSSGEQSIEAEGLLVMVLTVRNETEDQARETGNQLIDAFEEMVLANGTEKVFEALHEGSFEILEGTECLFAWLLPDGRARVIGNDGGRVVIQRGGEISQVFQLEHGERKGIQGQWQPNDRWLVGTAGLVDEMSQQLTRELLSELPPAEAGEEMVARVHGAEQNSLAAGVLLILDTTEPPVVETNVIHDIEEVGGQVTKGQRTPRIYLRSPLGGRRRAAIIGGILLLALIVSIGFGWYRREQQEWETAYQTLETAVREKLELAQTQATENPLAAKEQVAEAQKLIETGKVQFQEHETYGPQVIALAEHAQQVYEQVSGEQAIAEAPVWYELDLIREGMYGERMLRTGDALVVLDAQQGLVGQILLESKAAELVGGGELLTGAKLIAANGDRAVVLSNSGLVDMVMSKKTSAVLVAPEEVWQQPIGIGLFAGNVYFTDAGASEVWRYPGLAAGVGERQRWFGPGVEPDLSGATDMAIDGDIWLSYKDGAVERYRRGVRENFRITGLEEPLGELVAIDANEESENIYVVDRTNNRVVVVSKDGEYQKQVLWDGIAAATDVVADEAVGQVLVLSGNKIYSLPL